MDIIDTPRELSEISHRFIQSGSSIALVPTMGALHDGHSSLIHAARAEADIIFVSAFVNPLQFGNPDDLALYPSTRANDEEVCRRQGVHVLYRPEPAAMYPDGFGTSVHVSHLADILEGSSRPGHFDGVATVVAKLFNAARPHVAVFGEKDYQQVAVIRRMLVDLDMNIRLVVAPTVRESDGLAMSSRNVRLTPEARGSASKLHRALTAAMSAFSNGTTDVRKIDETIRSICADPLISLDYVEIVDAVTLERVQRASVGDVVLIAAIVGGIRLIDNIRLGTPLP